MLQSSVSCKRKGETQQNNRNDDQSRTGNHQSSRGLVLRGRTHRRRVLRGGAFNNNENNVRCANRNRNNPNNRNNNIGFRVVASTFFKFRHLSWPEPPGGVLPLPGRGEKWRSPFPAAPARTIQ
jgi:hypothetical protein